MSYKITCSHRGLLKSAVGLPIFVRILRDNKITIESPNELTPEQERKLFKLLADWFLQLKKDST
jgi:hypothetical protein